MFIKFNSFNKICKREVALTCDYLAHRHPLTAQQNFVHQNPIVEILVVRHGLYFRLIRGRHRGGWSLPDGIPPLSQSKRSPPPKVPKEPEKRRKENHPNASRPKREMNLHSTCSPLHNINHYKFELNIE